MLFTYLLLCSVSAQFPLFHLKLGNACAGAVTSQAAATGMVRLVRINPNNPNRNCITFSWRESGNKNIVFAVNGVNHCLTRVAQNDQNLANAVIASTESADCIPGRIEAGTLKFNRGQNDIFWTANGFLVSGPGTPTPFGSLAGAPKVLRRN